MAFRNVNPVVEKAMIRLQELTNDDASVFNTKGVDINPALIEHFIRNHFGGMPNEGYQLWARRVREKLGINLTEDQSYFARKFGAFVPERRHVGEYLKLRNKILTLANEAEKLPVEALALGNPDRKSSIYNKYPDLEDMVKLIEETDKELKELNKDYNQTKDLANQIRLAEGQENDFLLEERVLKLNQISETKKLLYQYNVQIFSEQGYREGVRPR